MKKRKKALAIVAHPDDETIWMGGMILKNKNWDWTIFSLCRKNDPDRAPRFMKVCEYYGARGIMSDLDDEILKPVSVEFLIGMIRKFLKEKEFDCIFTHGANGEYGHLRHKEIHKAVRKMIKDAELKCEKVYYFSYDAGNEIAPHDPRIKIPVPSDSAEKIIRLEESEYKNKFRLVTEIYGFKKDIFETLSCQRVESFILR